VLDVLDQIVVSGYVYEADVDGPAGEAPFEFTYQVPGKGSDDPVEWLRDAVHRALHL
jgi:hypothetical protein